LVVSNNILTFAVVNSKSDTEESDLIRSYKKQRQKVHLNRRMTVHCVFIVLHFVVRRYFWRLTIHRLFLHSIRWKISLRRSRRHVNVDGFIVSLHTPYLYMREMLILNQ
jgi:hypothetical protein